ncbi:hypothetical protein [Brevundimonas sp.]|uniref:hypothetical protein n=1 Tax=Brevundimonas sp. TaxID=1871086 RepID=UPI002D64FFF6|nr:hypothetical protein [Brevundimonas sp.]HYC99027.1 hypothetical protein [Brevundimonas sp.]
MELTTQEILKFDDSNFGFSHDRTWLSLPYCLTGKFEAEAVVRQFGSRTHPRIAEAIAGLCDLGKANPRETYRFRDFADAGLNEVQGLRYGPEVTILARASCWSVESGVIRIPILQPRVSPLTLPKLGVYLALARKAYCRGDWNAAQIEVIDLSEKDEDGKVVARVLPSDVIPVATDDEVGDFLDVYLAARRDAEKVRAERGGKKKPDRGPRPGDTLDMFPDGPG